MSVASSERRAPARGDRRTRRGRTSAPDDRRALSRNGLPAESDPSSRCRSGCCQPAVLAQRRHAARRTRPCWCCSTARSCPTRRCRAASFPGLGTEAVPIAAKYAAITAIPLSPAVPVGRPLPAAAVLGLADDLRLGRLRGHLRLGPGQHLGRRPPEHRRRRRPGHRGAGRDLRRAVRGGGGQGDRALLAGHPDALPVGQPAQRHRAGRPVRRGLRLRREHPLLRPRLPVRRADLRPGAAAGGAAAAVRAPRAA